MAGVVVSPTRSGRSTKVSNKSREDSRNRKIRQEPALEHGVTVLHREWVGRHCIIVASGSVLDFTGDVIVNAANPMGLDGGGVDGAITEAGGPELEKARFALPIVFRGPPEPGEPIEDIRIPTGEAKITIAGNIPVKWIVHAVGPRFTTLPPHKDQDRKLRTAYQKCLYLAAEKEASSMAFSLLSAGVFRGPRALKDPLQRGWNVIEEWCMHKGKGFQPMKIYMCAFTVKEQELLVKIAKKMDLNDDDKVDSDDSGVGGRLGRCPFC